MWKKVFVRKASGLVRAFSTKDVFIFNILENPLSSTIVIVPPMAIFAALDTDIVLASILYGALVMQTKEVKKSQAIGQFGSTILYVIFYHNSVVHGTCGW